MNVRAGNLGVVGIAMWRAVQIYPDQNYSFSRTMLQSGFRQTDCRTCHVEKKLLMTVLRVNWDANRASCDWKLIHFFPSMLFHRKKIGCFSLC